MQSEAGISRIRLRNAPALRSTKSFCFVPTEGDNTAAAEGRKDRELSFVQWNSSCLTLDREPGTARSSISPGDWKGTSENMAIPSIDNAEIYPGGLLSYMEEDEMAAGVHKLCLISIDAGEPPFLALRLAPEDEPAGVKNLIQELLPVGIRLLLVADHDLPALSKMPLAGAAGIILENACIMPDGTRRDFFRSAGLRVTAGRCAAERNERPDFFFGFLDLWTQPPRVSVIKRAEKVAAHFGAVLEHGPKSTQDDTILLAQPVASTSISGFEWLRRAETIQVGPFPASSHQKAEWETRD
jgi:hypothetical protein